MFVSVWILCLVSGLLAEGELDTKKVLNENFQADSSSELVEFEEIRSLKKEMQAMKVQIQSKVNSNYNSLSSRFNNLQSTVNRNYKSLSSRFNNLQSIVNRNYKSLSSRFNNLQSTVNRNYKSLSSIINSNYKYFKSNQLRCVAGGTQWQPSDVKDKTFKFYLKFTRKPQLIVALHGIGQATPVWVNYSHTASSITLSKSSFNKKAYVAVRYLACGVTA